MQVATSDFSDNTLRAINAARCILANFGENTWNLVAAGYWFANAFVDAEVVINPILESLYASVCTC